MDPSLFNLEFKKQVIKMLKEILSIITRRKQNLKRKTPATKSGKMASLRILPKHTKKNVYLSSKYSKPKPQ